MFFAFTLKSEFLSKKAVNRNFIHTFCKVVVHIYWRAIIYWRADGFFRSPNFNVDMWFLIELISAHAFLHYFKLKAY